MAIEIMKTSSTLATALLVAAVAACSNSGENYDTGYDTSNPYGVPESLPYGTPDATGVNPPADPSYGAAAYDDSSRAITSSPPPMSSPAAAATTHTVTRGDTLWALSRKYGVSVSALRQANGMMANDDTIRIGQTLQIPSP